MLCYEAACHLLVTGDEQEGFGLGGALGLHLLESQVIVHHLPDLLHLGSEKRKFPHRYSSLFIYFASQTF